MNLQTGLFLLHSLITFSVFPVCWSSQQSYAHQLMKDLFTGYSNIVRPVKDTAKVINVTLQTTLTQIVDMDEQKQILTTYLWIQQVWFDSYLTWNRTEYGGLDNIQVPSSLVWKPDIVLYNSADDQSSSPMATNVLITHNGQIMWYQPAITKSSCKVDVSYFPFDAQECHLKFGSWTHNGNQIDVINTIDSAELDEFVENAEWELLGMPAKKNVIRYACCSEPYPDITYTLRLKRRASFYIFNLLIPCMLISFLAPLGFYLPADSKEKVSLGVTVLLALIVFQLLVAESMPPSENVPLIGKYYIAMMTMITASTALTIFIMNIHHCGPEAHPVPEWVRLYILNYLARICFVYEVGETETVQTKNTTSGQTRGDELAIKMQGVSTSGAGDAQKTNDGKEEVEDDLRPVLSTEATVQQHQLLLRNIEYIANCYHDQKATQRRTGEWRKVAKVMDRFFMWIFFIMVFLVSLVIIIKAI